jgi:hypothetical protein
MNYITQHKFCSLFQGSDLDSVELQFEIMQDDNPFDLTGKTIELAILKPSGKTVFQNVEIISGN